MIAASAGHADICRYLLSSGASVNAATDQGRSSLLYACSKNHYDVARILLDNHADINLQDKFGSSPLHRAASCGRVK
jgi:26S proteasome non-ATPase regulatory subunit 10